MSLKQTVIDKAAALSSAEFAYTVGSDFAGLGALDNDCTGLVMDATVLYLEIKNLSFMLKTGKRLAARMYKFYYHALHEIAEQTGGHLNCYGASSFLLIYPKERFEVADVVDIAIKTADLIGTGLRETIEQHSHVNFGIGVDKGNILASKVLSDGHQEHTVWFGTAIDKAIAICHECTKPYYVGISGTVYQHLDEDHRVATKRILGIKKHIELWTKVSYQFDNVKKHLYQTNFHKSFEEE